MIPWKEVTVRVSGPDAEAVRQLTATLGGRFSIELEIDVDRGPG
jgi:endonuclease III